MVSGRNLISGREALHLLDDAVARARDAYEAAAGAVERQASRRGDIARQMAASYHRLAEIRMDVLRGEARSVLRGVEVQARGLLDEHEAWLARLTSEAAAAKAEVEALEDRRRDAEAAADAAAEAYEAQVEETGRRLAADAAYTALKDVYERAVSIVARAGQKLDLARADRETKGVPYEADPLFSYLWKRRFRTPDYRAGGLERMLDNWVARVCGYDRAYLNYARLTELPDRLAEHRVKVEAARDAAQAALEAAEEAALRADGADGLRARMDEERKGLSAIDGEIALAEARLVGLRQRLADADAGAAGPAEQAREMIENGLEQATFPDLRLLAAQTVGDEDDRLVETLVKLRTEELSMEIGQSSVNRLPSLRRVMVDELEQVRRRFKDAQFDSPYVAFAGPAFEAALAAYGVEEPDGPRLWRAIGATLRQAPQAGDRYFGGSGRRSSISIPEVAGVILEEVVREAVRSGTRRGGWGPGGPWSGGGWGGGDSGGSRSPPRRSGGGRKGGGGFRTGGGF